MKIKLLHILTIILIITTIPAAILLIPSMILFIFVYALYKSIETDILKSASDKLMDSIKSNTDIN